MTKDMAAPADDVMQAPLPGLGLPLDAYDDNDAGIQHFPTAVLDWQANTPSLRERSMYWFVNTITDKPEWATKVFDDAIVAKWKAEVAEFAARGAEAAAEAEKAAREADEWVGSVTYPPIARGFSDVMFEYCIRELRDKAKIAQAAHGFVSVFDGASAVVKSDSAVPQDVTESLRALAAKLEAADAEAPDWHPGSDGKVRDLVHPSLWPLVYGRTRIARVGALSDTTAAYASGTTIPEPKPPSKDSKSVRLYSTKFQWLPADVDVDADGNAKFVSYINNLHPDQYDYTAIERLLSAALPALDAVYTRTTQWDALMSVEWDDLCILNFTRSRMRVDDSNRTCTVKDICAGGCGRYKREQDPSFVQRDDEDEYEAGDRWYEERHPVLQPEPLEYEYLGIKEYRRSAQEWFPRVAPGYVDERIAAATPAFEKVEAERAAIAAELREQFERRHQREEAERKRLEAEGAEGAGAGANAEEADNDGKAEDLQPDEDEDVEADEEADDDVSADDNDGEADEEDANVNDEAKDDNEEGYDEDAEASKEPAGDDDASKEPASKEDRPHAPRPIPTRLQVIVKLANIHLTPEKPTYDGGSWHIEGEPSERIYINITGQLNERICATVLYYYDCENITESKLGFKSNCNAEKFDEEGFSYEQGDHEPFKVLYGQFPGYDEDTTEMDLGEVVTREGRMIVFPNVFRHRVAPFELADKTKPGHRKIVALFLIDPDSPVISTSLVPPQQLHWGSLLDSKLPAEVAHMVYNHLECPYSLSDAKKLREELIEERKAIDVVVDSVVTEDKWCFCEH